MICPKSVSLFNLNLALSTQTRREFTFSEREEKLEKYSDGVLTFIFRTVSGNESSGTK